MNQLDSAIREFTPVDSDWLPLERLFQDAFESSEPRQYYHAIFNLFERYPDDDGEGVFWSALHGMEAMDDYEDLLLQYFRRFPSLMTKTMLIRMVNSGQTHIGEMALSVLLGEQDKNLG